jgi:hypothetical protein
MPALRRTSGLCSAALLGVAALALHQLRYLAATGRHADALVAQGHGYLEVLAPVLASLCLATIAGQLLASAARSSAGSVPDRAPLRHAASCAVALLTIFCVQELTEAAFSNAYGSPLEVLLADRGWVVLPIAVALGALVSLVFRGVGKLERRVHGTLVPPRRRLPVPLEERYEQPPLCTRASLALVFGFSRRPPPFATVH